MPKKTALRTTVKKKAVTKKKKKVRAKSHTHPSAQPRSAASYRSGYRPGYRPNDEFQRTLGIEIIRPFPRAAFKRSTAYYALGLGTLGVALFLVGILTYQSDHLDQTQTQLPQLGQPLHENKTRQPASQPTSPQPELPQSGSPQSVVPQVPPVQENSVLDSEFREAQSLSLQDRMNYWSHFIEKNSEGRSKIISIAKETPVSDLVPLVSESYNCTTFVETVAALARSNSSNEFAKNLIAIRYRNSQAEFFSRNHFPEVDWIPNNREANILEDITVDLAKQGGFSVEVEKKEINRSEWLKKQIKNKQYPTNLISQMHQEWAAPVAAELPYISLKKLKEILSSIPTGTVLNVVHKNNDRHPVLISHQGYVIHEGGRVFLRHASRNGHIRTNELWSYLMGVRNQRKSNIQWPLIGVNLNQFKASNSANNLRTD